MEFKADGRAIFYLENSITPVILESFRYQGAFLGVYSILSVVLILAVLSVTAVNGDIIATYDTELSGYQGNIEALASEYSSDEREITGVVTMEFDVAEDGIPTVKLIGSSVNYAPFNDALLSEAESWGLQPHTEAEVIIYKQFVINTKSYIPMGQIEGDCPIPGSTGYSDGIDMVCEGLKRTRNTMDYRYDLYLEEYPGSGGFALLILYVGGDGYVSYVSTKYSDIEDYTFRGEIEGWLKANTFPGFLPPDAKIAFPISFKPKGGFTPDTSVGDYQICLMGYKDILLARYQAYMLGEGTVGGAVTISVEIGAEGDVIAAEVTDTDIGDSGFVELIPEIITEWRFPPGNGATIELTFQL